MDIPLSYNLRNLVARRTTTIMTALGIALTVAVLLSILALVQGLNTALATTGHPLNVLVMRKGATAELNSTITQETFCILKVKPGIARDDKGERIGQGREQAKRYLEEHPEVLARIETEVLSKHGITKKSLNGAGAKSDEKAEAPARKERPKAQA